VILVPVTLVSFTVETLLYGCYLTLFVITLCLMTNATPSVRGERHTYPKPMRYFSILVFFLVTAHWILSVVQAFQGSGPHPNSPGPVGPLGGPPQLSLILRDSVLMGLFVTSELTIIYRLWSVWNHSRRVVIFPIALLFVLSVFTVMQVYALATGNTIVHNLETVIIGIGASSLSIDIYSGGMIIYKLCLASKVARDREDVSRFRFIIFILVESLSLYSIWGMIFGILSGFNSPVSLVFGDTQCPMIGIAFALLYVRVGMRRINCDAATLVEGTRSPRQAKGYGEV